MAKAFTTKAVENFKPDPDKRLELPDPGLPGLYLIVQPTGAKGWALRYRWAGKPKKLTLGRWPIMGLADARAAASAAIEEVERGSDPGAKKKATKAARLEAQLTERDKVKTLVADYARRHLAALKSGATVRRELERHVVGAWGERDIHDITRRDVIDLLDGLADSGRVVTANRVRAYLNTFLAWCIEREVITTSPAAGVKAAGKETSRSRVLSDDEVRWFWSACEAEGYPWGRLGQILLLTGQRLNEVAQMTDAELQGDLWHLPAERVKNGRTHTVPLSAPVQALLGRVERVAAPAGFIFTTTGRAPVQGFHKARAILAGKMKELAGEERGEPVEIPHWTFHDLRRTCATGMARIGIPVRVTEAVLNHVSGTGGGIVGVYQRHDFADEKRQALDAWARVVMNLTHPGENVVQLPERGQG